MSQSNGGYGFSELREQLINEELPVLRDAGLLDEDTVRYLESFREHYEPNTLPHHEKPDETAYWYHNTTEYVETVRRDIGQNLRRAVQRGNLGMIEHATGLGGHTGTNIDFVEYERFGELIERPSLLLFLFGDTGSGKTYTGVSVAEMWRLRVGGQILTNIKSLAEAEADVFYADDYPSLIRHCVEHPDTRKLFLADELSSLMSGYASDRSKVEELMRPFVRKMRKRPFRVSIVGIGHRPGDIHPTLRNGELAYPAFKRDLKTLQVYESLDGGENGEDEICTLSGIEEPEMRVDTNDSGNWSWGTDDEVLDAAHALRDAGYGDMLELIRQLEEDDAGDADGDEDEQETVVCAESGCQATSEQYPSVRDTGVCPYHSTDASDASGE